MSRRALQTAIAILTITALLLGCDNGDQGTMVAVHKLVTITETDAVDLPGQRLAAHSDTVVMWLGPGLARRDVGRASFLVDAVRGEFTQVDHAERHWTRASAADISLALATLAQDSVQGVDRQTRMLQKLLNISARVTDMDESRTIDGYPCRRWVVEQSFGEQNTRSEVWLTDAIAVDSTLLQRVTQPALAAVPGGRQALVELSKLRGVPVRAAAFHTILNRETRSESRLVSVDEMTVPLSFFSPPADYALTQPDS